MINWLHHMAYGRPRNIGRGGRKFCVKTFMVRIAARYAPRNRLGEAILMAILKLK